jgi:putative heme-binding domain-containing protein
VRLKFGLPSWKGDYSAEFAAPDIERITNEADRCVGDPSTSAANAAILRLKAIDSRVQAAPPEPIIKSAMGGQPPWRKARTSRSSTMRRFFFAFSLAVTLLLHAATSKAGVEPWADAKLPVQNGLVAWLDASVQAAAREKLAQPPVADMSPLDKWLDGSGAKHDFAQPDAAMRPRLRLWNKSAFVRFSGRGVTLRAETPGLELHDATVFIVAAPQANEGGFRGLFSAHAKDKNDFTSGVNIDIGYAPSAQFDAVNVEGAGFGGQKNLRTAKNEFAQLHRLCVTSTPGDKGVQLYVDGQAEGSRERKPGVMKADQLFVGARFIADFGGVGSYFDGDIAEVLVYDRLLSADERKAVDDYLAAKYGGIGKLPPKVETPGERRLARVKNPPALQMFVPGFSVRELPVQLTNINNVQYRDDGALVALAYDGNVYLLRDKDGDGLEEDVTEFWKNDGQIRSPIGMALTPPGYKLGRGVFVPSKSKLSLIVDKDGDDKADEEIIVAKGWKESFHQVDALGVDVDPRDQSIYFGLGTWNFANGYQINDKGVAEYKLSDEHGTIMHVSPDFKSRETVCTGIRFPVSLRFNKDGDLFCTDQEGATWLPNGNPFDELLHIQQGRHYGFPPRHPRHLPNVIDEPSVFDYRPQHQSTCGMNFNEPTIDSSTFGPEWWQHDTLVTGYSRAKLWRTKLTHTETGYIGQTQLLGTANMLLVDACVAPGGSLVVAAHSGGPDWGSGPSGMGKLYKVTYEKAANEAIPSLVWAESPREVRIAFDRPVDPKLLAGLATRASIDGGEFVAAGDRFESLRPGYAVVQRQMNLPRFGVDVQNVQLTPDERTLILTTAPHRSAVGYSITLPGARPQEEAPGKQPPALPQQPDIDLGYDLCGVEATWTPGQGDPIKVWLPHLDLEVARAFTIASAEHDKFWKAIKGTGTLTLRTKLDLKDMLHPAVQPGATLDYEPAKENVSLTFQPRAAECRISVDPKSNYASAGSTGDVVLKHVMTPAPDSPVSIEVNLRRKAASDPLEFKISFNTLEEDARPRALPLRRFLLPWAERSTKPTEIASNADLPELKGGNWLRGQQEFFGSQAGCSKCHAIRGQGGKIGPNLSNLPLRDYASVLRDVTQPSFAINPDYVSQKVLLDSGKVLTGIARVEGDKLIVADTEGKETIVPRAEVESFEHSPQSIMPEGLPKALGEARLRDLLTFLLVEPPHMPVYGDHAPPAPRTMAEVNEVLAGSKPATSNRPLHIVLVAGPKDHGVGEHDYPAWKKVWQKLFELAENVRVTTAENWPSAEDLKTADALVFFQHGDWTPERARDTDAFLARGGGLTYIHYAVDGGKDAAGFAERIGLAWDGAHSKFRHGELDVQFVPGSKHPIARNFSKVRFYDESYWQSTGDPQRIDLLATGVEDGKPQPLFWTREHAGGRVFVSIPGHFAWTFDDPLFRTLLLRGVAWTAKEPVDRFNDLVLPGARVAEEASAAK